MNISRRGLAVLAVVGFALPAAAAPAPAPAPPLQGPISDALRLRGLLPQTPPPLVHAAAMIEEGVIGLEHRALVPMEVTRIVTVFVERQKEVTEKVQLPGGKVGEVKRLVREVVPVMETVKQIVYRAGGKVETVRVPVKSCTFFTVSKEGKLEALDAAKATALLKQRTAILTGDSATVDPRHLELVKPGTVYLVIPPPPLRPPHEAPPREGTRT